MADNKAVPRTTATNSHTDPRFSRKVEGRVDAQRLNPGARLKSKDDAVEVFVTYGDEHVQPTVQDICGSLEAQQIKVHIDYEEQKMQSINLNQWMDGNIEGGENPKHFVIVCVDENYKEFACGHESTDDSDDQEKTMGQYIFNVLQTKIINQGCLNFKYLPVLINGAKHSDLPLVFQSSKVYRWPRDEDRLLDRLFCRQRYIRPRLGRTPVPEFQSVR